MADGARGTVTPLGSLFPAEESQKAAQRVQEAITERRGELRRLQNFVSDNSALIQLVHSLPDELSHDIMVPFGGAAFFPGRLIHTNEFLVLLGEGYYADRSAKQTVDILQRRGKILESKVESLKATMADLEAQAKFFSNTAAEAAEGLVEIREEYIEEPEESVSNSSSLAGSNSLDLSETDNLQKPDENQDEDARFWARIGELEKEEEEFENRCTSVNDNEDSEDIVSPHEDSNEDEDAEDGDEDEDAEASYNFSKSDHKHDVLEIKHKSNDPVQKSKGQETFSSIDSKQIGGISEQHLTDQFFTDSKMKFPDEAPSFSNNKQSISNEKSAASPSDAKFSFSNIEDSSKDAATQSSNPVSSDHKAFTGSIVEHDIDLPPIQSSKSTNLVQSSGSSSSKPVSRFKMQRGNR